MGKIGDITTLALVIGGGYLLLKNWAGIKDFFGSFAEGIGTLAGGAPGTGAPGLSGAIFTGVDVPITDEPITEPFVSHIPSFVDLVLGGTITPTPIDPADIVPDPRIQPPSIFDLINPFSGIAGRQDYVESLGPPPSAPSVPGVDYTPSQDPYYQPSEIVPADPGHPATDPFLGGR